MDVACGTKRVLIGQILDLKWNEYSIISDRFSLKQVEWTIDRYGLEAEISRGSEVSTSRGMSLFKGSFDLFKSQIRRHQRLTSTWNVTRWAIHDAKKFEDMINRLKDFVDGLESITKS